MYLFDYLEQTATQLASLKVFGFPAIAILHVVWVSWSFRRTAPVNKMAPLTALVATWILSFGGTTLTAIILGNPWSWIQGDVNFPLYTIIPLIIYYSPNDVVFQAMESAAAVLLPAMTVSDSISKTMSISMAGVDAVRSHASGSTVLRNSWYAAVFCGTLSGCGGGIIGSMLGLDEPSWTLKTPSQFSRPNVSLVASFLGAVVYMLLTTQVIAAKASPLGALLAVILAVNIVSHVAPMTNGKLGLPAAKKTVRGGRKAKKAE